MFGLLIIYTQIATIKLKKGKYPVPIKKIINNYTNCHPVISFRWTNKIVTPKTKEKQNDHISSLALNGQRFVYSGATLYLLLIFFILNESERRFIYGSYVGGYIMLGNRFFFCFRLRFINWIVYIYIRWELFCKNNK